MKKKIKRKLAAAVGIISLLLGVYQVNAAEGGCDVEQILLHMPEVTMYYRASEPEESYEAYLDGKALEYSSTALFKETGEGVDYYLMLDVSASIPRDKFENIKNGIRKFISEMRENDKCILLTFGNESKVVLNGTEGSERAETLIQELKNEDMETVLFQSIVQSAEMIEKAAQTEEKRRVIVTITDGEDCVTGQATASEALRTLNDKGIPLFAMAVDVGKQEYINSFGEFARNTGGTLNIYAQGDSSIVFDSIKNTVENSFVAYFRNDTNIAENKRTDFTVKFLEHQTMKNREVIPSRWIPDKDAPTVKEVKPQGENELVLIFSEPVLGADVQGNYRIEKDEKAIATGSVSYSKEKMRTVLTFEKPLYSGDYTIFFSGITDNSMEKNPLKESKTFHLEGAEEPKEEKESRFEKWWWMLPVGCVLLFAILGGFIVVIYRKVKKNKGVIYVDGKATLASNVNVKHHVSVNNLPQKKIKLKINDKINGEFVLDVLIDGSVIAGRNNECDVYFDDLNMSRQHFALETDGTGVYITDLESSNGTFVNGIRVNQRTELQSNDEIAAGNIHARIFW